MDTRCPHCNQEFEIDHSYAGESVQCTECGQSFVIVEFKNSPLVKKVGAVQVIPAVLMPEAEQKTTHTIIIQNGLPYSANENMSTCRSCKRPIAVNAKICPLCGEQNPHETNWEQGALGCVVFLIAAIVIGVMVQAC